MAAAPLDAALSAEAAGSQSPIAITAVGRSARAALTTAHAPSSSAAGMDSTGSCACSWRRARSAVRSGAVAAPLASASCTS
eukprot:3515260-Pleurochrysis_carterae.AAC.1